MTPSDRGDCHIFKEFEMCGFVLLRVFEWLIILKYSMACEPHPQNRFLTPFMDSFQNF